MKKEILIKLILCLASTFYTLANAQTFNASDFEITSGTAWVKEPPAVKLWAAGWVKVADVGPVQSVNVFCKNISNGDILPPKLSIGQSETNPGGGIAIDSSATITFQTNGDSLFYLWFTNDFYSSSGDRNLEIDSIAIVPFVAPEIDTLVAYTVILSWDANTETDLAGYKVRWKEINKPVYDLYTTKDISMEIQGLQGHSIAGVAAYDTSGNQSIFTSIEFFQQHPAANDTTAPAIPRGFKVSTGQIRIIEKVK